MRIVPASLLLEISDDYLNHRARREASWYGYTNGETWGAIPFAVRTLYRGQNSHYTPLLPSIARGLKSTNISELWKSPISDQAKILFRIAQSWWFSRELHRHPISNHAAKNGLDLDPIALAQHYGIPTGYIDLTDDFTVSAFFATCRQTSGGWESIDSGEGVIYRVKLDNLQSPFGRYEPLGPQKLPRPSEQCAWVTELPLCHSFEGWPGVDVLTFEQDRRIGEHFLKMYEGGNRLFPPDPLADVSKEILLCGEIPADLMESALDSYLKDPAGIVPEQLPDLRRELSGLVSQINYRRLLTDEQVAILHTNKEWRENYLDDVCVKWRAVSRIPIEEVGVSKK